MSVPVGFPSYPLSILWDSGEALGTESTTSQRNEDPSKPISGDRIDFAVVEVVMYAIMLPVTLYIAWKHGKRGQVCWPILALFLMTRFIADGFIIADSSDVVLNAIASSFTTSISIMCLTSTLLGMSAEAYVTCFSHLKE